MYLLECLQKTPPPVGSIVLLFCRQCKCKKHRSKNECAILRVFFLFEKSALSRTRIDIRKKAVPISRKGRIFLIASQIFEPVSGSLLANSVQLSNLSRSGFVKLLLALPELDS